MITEELYGCGVTAPEEDIFDAIESEIEKERIGELDDEDTSAPKIKRSRRGDINALYDAYKIAKDNADGSLQSKLDVERAKDSLLGDVADYTLRLFGKQGSSQPALNKIAGEDVAQDVVIKTFKYLETFKGDCRFSVWLHRVYTGVLRDAIEKEKNRRESSLNDAVRRYESKTNAVVVTHGTRAKTHDADSDYTGVKNDNDDGAEILPPSILFAEENGIVQDVTLQEIFSKLSSRDKYICKLLVEGYSPKEISAKSGLGIKATYNKLYSLKETLKHELCIQETVLHTCRLSVTTVQPSDAIVGYVQQDAKSEYRSLPLTCRCRKSLTKKEARELLATGAASEIFHLKNGKLTLDEGRIWASQAVQVPRCGLAANSSAGIDKATSGNVQLQRDIEIGHAISALDLNKRGAEVRLVRGSLGRPINECNHAPYEYRRYPFVLEQKYFPTPKDDDAGSGIVLGEYSPLYYAHRNLPEHCWCVRCVERRNVPVSDSKVNFADEMLRYGFRLWTPDLIQEVITASQGVCVVETPIETLAVSAAPSK